MRRIALAVGLLFAGCGGETVTAAPDPGPIQTVCLEEVCIDYPADWSMELGDDFMTFSHPDGPRASVGRIDMRGVRESAGDGWPADAESTMRSFWSLLDELGSASLDELVVGDGYVDTTGSLDGGRLWHRLLPADPPRAWGAEVRARDRGWVEHAAIIVGSLRAP